MKNKLGFITGAAHGRATALVLAAEDVPIAAVIVATLLNATGQTAAGLLIDKWLVKVEKK